MSGKGLLIGSAVLALPVLTEAQDFSAAQAANVRLAPQVISAIQAGDAEALGRIDPSIDYAAGPRQAAVQIDSATAAELFEGCDTPIAESASQFRDFLTLNFSCPNRVSPNECVTGDLQVMLYPGSPVSIGVIEKNDFSKRECRPSAPPPPPMPRREVNQ